MIAIVFRLNLFSVYKIQLEFSAEDLIKICFNGILVYS
jgi:hypothetical protein